MYKELGLEELASCVDALGYMSAAVMSFIANEGTPSDEEKLTYAAMIVENNAAEIAEALKAIDAAHRAEKQ